jgi:hypothetical protein
VLWAIAAKPGVRYHPPVLRVLTALCLLGPALALARPGDLGDPLAVPAFPFVHASTTVGRSSAIARYDCAPTSSEAGPEVVYRLAVPTAGRLSAWVQSAPGIVDHDVHVLSSTRVDGRGTAQGCITRANDVAVADVLAGEYFVVVDTYANASLAGPYRLRIDFQPDDGGYERPLARGVTLWTRRYASLNGAVEFASLLLVDLADPDVVVKPIVPDRCTITSAMARAAGAVAAVNGGPFTPDPCAPAALLRLDGQTLAENPVARGALGFDGAGRAHIELVAPGDAWPGIAQAVGGVPRLVVDGGVDVRAQEEGWPRPVDFERDARTAAGIRADGTLLLATVDARTIASEGMTLRELAQWMAGVGAVQALNLEGGEFTSFWAQGEPWGGVVNYPVFGRANHLGEHPVHHAIGVWAAPIDRDAVWLTAPPPGPVRAGDTWSYEAVAADPEGAPVAYRAEGDLVGALGTTDRGDGTARFRFVPRNADAARSPVALRFVAEVEGSRPVDQTVTLEVLPGIDEPDAGAGADAGAVADAGAEPDAGGADAGAGGDAGALAGGSAIDAGNGGAPASAPRGCGCGAGADGGESVWLAILAVVACTRRARVRDRTAREGT